MISHNLQNPPAVVAVAMDKQFYLLFGWYSKIWEVELPRFLCP